MTTTTSDGVRHEEIALHGHRVSYKCAGDSGPVIILIHGITGSSQNWSEVMPELGEEHQVIAPDLLGHGESAKPRGDYSLGAYASAIRDLMLALGHESATVVGHSLGGGVAMQVAYQFPERIDRLVLVSSGGLGREVHLLLRSVALPGAEFVLPLLSSSPVRDAGDAIGRLLGRLGLRPGPDLQEIARGFASLGDVDARQAFIHTARSIIDVGGQRVSATDRLYLSEAVPSLIMWGERDPIIPVKHARTAYESMPGSRLEIFERSGHFPQLFEPRRFVKTLDDFMTGTEAADIDADDIREVLLGRSEQFD